MLYQREHVIGVLALLIFFGLSDKISEAALAHRDGEKDPDEQSSADDRLCARSVMSTGPDLLYEPFLPAIRPVD